MLGKIVSAGRADLPESVGTESVAAVGAELIDVGQAEYDGLRSSNGN